MSFELNRITWLPWILISFPFFYNPLTNLSNLDGSGGNLGSVKLLNQTAFSTNGTVSCVINFIPVIKSCGIRMIHVRYSTVGTLSKSDVIM